MKHRLTATALLAAALFLSACDTAEERAEKHFQTGLELVESGDTTKAVIEMRNALQLDPSHAEARLTLADIQYEHKELQRAVHHYRTLLEYYPETGAAHLSLAEILLDAGDWDNTRKHGDEAERLLGESPRVAAVMANLSYRDALDSEDREARDAALSKGAAALEADPELMSVRRMLVDADLRAENWEDALSKVDSALEIDAERLDFARMRLSILQELGRTEDIAVQLEDMVLRFPDEEAIPLMTVRWYLGQEDIESAVNFMRARVEEAPADADRQLQLVQLINEVQGPEAAIAELTRLVEMGTADSVRLAAMRANLMFATGRQEEALSDMETLVAELEELDAKEEESPDSADKTKTTNVNDVRADLARMKAMSGDPEAAKGLIETTLESNPSHPAALKMKATWQIDEDNVEQAIINLRSALRESPRDPQIMTLMAAAHERAGESALQAEMLALAVETSESAPEESLRYARLLVVQERFRPAEDVLIQALRLTPNNVALLSELGRVYLGLEDIPRAEQVQGSLQRLFDTTNDPAAEAAVNTLQAQLLASQDRESELFEFLDNLAEGESGLVADIAIVRAHIGRGDIEQARNRLDELLAENPDQPVLRFLSAAVLATEGKADEAEAELEALLVDAPNAERVWMALYRLKLMKGDQEGASAVLDRALAALPNAGELLFSRAGELERQGKIEEAIGIYEILYERNSSSEVVANNLASLLSTYREGPETLERAYRIGRRLQDSEVAAFRDTYGWIAARLGRLEEAETHLKYAVEGLSAHPLVQFHYAVVLADLERNEEALEHFTNAVTLAGVLLPATDLETAQAEIERLSAGIDPDAAAQE